MDLTLATVLCTSALKMAWSSFVPGTSSLRGALRTAVVACLILLAGAAASFGQEANHDFLMRFPDVHGSSVIFVAGGDLWIAPVQGGVATRLTMHDGSETSPKFSNDGSLIGFTAKYDGNADVFVVPLAGGEPKRLTWHPAPDQAVGWTPDGRSIVFRSPREMPHDDPELFTALAMTGAVIAQSELGFDGSGVKVSA